MTEAQARLKRWLAEECPGALLRWLPSQRWFGAKSQTIAASAVQEVVWIDRDAGVALVIVDVTYTHAGADDDCYAIVVGAAGTDRAGLAPLSADGAIVDGSSSATAVQALLMALLEGAPLAGEHGGQIRFADVTPVLSRALTSTPAPTVRALRYEQSNTSVRIGSTHVFKLIRRLQEGEHPQLEIGRFLRRTSFRAAPPLDGSMVYVAADGRAFAIGVIEGWVENGGDGWTYVVGRLSAAAEGTPATTLNDDFAQLGATTADFHLALSSDSSTPAFTPEPVTARDLDAWRYQVVSGADRTLSLVARVVAGWPAGLVAQGRALLGARARIEQRVAALVDRVAGLDFRTMRIHGDFHLGQTLKTVDGFVLIDFEGEPMKPMAQRRLKQCALKDVAGLLRSIDYAVADVRARIPDAPVAALATDSLRRAFRQSYVARSRSGAARYLPAPEGAVRALAELFELEKALYELDYEINNRPDWIQIPLGAAVRLLAIAA